MITLTAEIRIQGENPNPFLLGVSRLGENLLGTSIDNTEVINKRNILSLETEIRDRSEIDKPSFGVISSGGRLSFRDTNLKFLAYANNGILNGGETIYIFLNNTISRNRKKVGEYFASNWSYDNDNRSVSVPFNDNLEHLQEINSPQIGVYYGENPMTLFDVFKMIYNNKNIRVSSKAEGIMYKIKSSFFYKEKSNVWGDLNKFCEIGGFHIYNDVSGKTIMSSEFDME